MLPPLPKLVVATIGARRQYAVPRILDMAYWLEIFFTDFYVRSNVAARWARSPFFPEFIRALGGRHSDDLTFYRVRDFPFFALRRLWMAAHAHTEGARWRAFAAWNQKFARLVAAADWKAANGVYVFNAAGLEILERATREGIVRFVDQTTLPWVDEQQVIAEERARWPDWERGDTQPSDWAELAAREQAEWSMADAILCGSENVREALIRQGVNPRLCEVVPYGVAPELDAVPTKEDHDGPLRVLFVGTLELRKGIPYLAEAARRLPPSAAAFRVVGPSRLSDAAIRQMSIRMDILGPKSRAGLQHDYAWADLLVLPTLAEGSANVCYEAMARRLPVITTPAAGSQVRDGQDGFIVPTRDPEALAERIERLTRDRRLLKQMSEAAFEQAKKFDLEHYASRLTAAIRARYNGHTPSSA